jgi:effector-binding domain-containing protein
MNYHKSRKYYKDFKENFERNSFDILNKLCCEVYSTNSDKQFGICRYGCSMKFRSEDKSKEMNTKIFYTITPDSLNKNIQKMKVEKLFFQHSQLCKKEIYSKGKSYIKLNSLQPYYLVQFTKRKIC